MLDQKGFDLWADGYDRAVGLSDGDNSYPFAGYKEVLKIVREHHIAPDFVYERNLPTITKLRVLSRNQQLLRLDFEDSFSNLDEDAVVKSFEESIKDSKVIIFSDYGKGSLSCIRRMIAIANEKGIPSLVDPKGTDFSKYEGATLLTPNMSEFEAVAGKVHSDEELEEKALELISKCKLKMLLVTRSEDGMSLIRPGMKPVHLPTYAREVYDVTGAGDTVIGTLATCLASPRRYASSTSLLYFWYKDASLA